MVVIPVQHLQCVIPVYFQIKPYINIVVQTNVLQDIINRTKFVKPAKQITIANYMMDVLVKLVIKTIIYKMDHA